MRITFDGGSEAGGFRSALERKVADELDRHGVAWRYEVPIDTPDGRRMSYLPDFTIDDSRDELQLPAWVECKPQQMLYDLRDALGVTRRAGEFFSTDVHVEGVTPRNLRDMGLAELAKPKTLADATGLGVLVIGTVSGTRTMSALMLPGRITFSRSHPFVNWPGVMAARRREQERLAAQERFATWRRDLERAQRDAELARAERLAKARSAAAQIIHTHRRYTPQFASTCNVCAANHGRDGGLYRVQTQFNERWIRVCPLCEASS